MKTRIYAAPAAKWLIYVYVVLQTTAQPELQKLLEAGLNEFASVAASLGEPPQKPCQVCLDVYSMLDKKLNAPVKM